MKASNTLLCVVAMTAILSMSSAGWAAPLLPGSPFGPNPFSQPVDLFAGANQTTIIPLPGAVFAGYVILLEPGFPPLDPNDSSTWNAVSDLIQFFSNGNQGFAAFSTDPFPPGQLRQPVGDLFTQFLLHDSEAVVYHAEGADYVIHSEFSLPEPSSILLAVCGVMGLVVYAWKSRRAKPSLGPARNGLE